MWYRSFFILCLLCGAVPAWAVEWQIIQPGLQYTVLKPVADNLRAKVHTFKIDLKNHRLDIALAQEQGRQATSVAKLARHHEALVAINGGFFTPQRAPIGLRIKDSQVLYPMQPTSWWGVFMLQADQPKIIAQQTYQPAKNIQLAIQAGPRLLVNGRIPALKTGTAERSAVCITRNGEVILAATEHFRPTTTQLAEILRNDLQCYNALNLDGGNSTQLYANTDNISVSVMGLSGITDALIVLPK